MIRRYIGASRTVNVVELLDTVDSDDVEGSYSEQMRIYWDQATGLLLELTLEIQEGSTGLSMLQYLAVETNVWTTGLSLNLQLSAASVEAGSPVTVTADVTDAMNASVTGAIVTARCGNLSILLIDLGSGTYQGTIATITLTEGTHTVQVTVQQTGYPSTQAETPLTITPADMPLFYYLGFAGVLASLSIGALFWRRRRTSTPLSS
jgi:hypothetical protein